MPAAVPTDDPAADATIALSLETWAEVFSGRTTLSAAETDGAAIITGDRDGLRTFFDCFDAPQLRSTWT